MTEKKPPIPMPLDDPANAILEDTVAYLFSVAQSSVVLQHRSGGLGSDPAESHEAQMIMRHRVIATLYVALVAAADCSGMEIDDLMEWFSDAAADGLFDKGVDLHRTKIHPPHPLEQILSSMEPTDESDDPSSGLH